MHRFAVMAVMAGLMGVGCVGEELPPNGSFEDWSGSAPASWETSGPMVRVLHETGKAVQLHAPATLTSSEFHVVPGTTYTLRVVARGPGEWSNFSRLTALLWWGNGPSSEALFVGKTDVNPTDWTVYQREIGVPAYPPVTLARVRLVAGRDAPEVVEVDEVTLTPVVQ